MSVPPRLEQALDDAAASLKQLDQVRDMAIVAAWLAAGTGAQAGADLDELLLEITDVYQTTQREMRAGGLTPDDIQKHHTLARSDKR